MAALDGADPATCTTLSLDGADLRAPGAMPPADAGAPLLDKVMFVAEYPFSWLRWLSTGSFDGRWNRRRRLLATVAPDGSL